MSQHFLFEADCLTVLRELPSNAFDACLTDPPYGIEFLGLDWDKALPPVEVWREVLRCLKPGSPMFVFSAPRKSHWSGMQLEQAGFDVVDSLYWFYGQGMPKSDALLKPFCEPIHHLRKPGPVRDLNIDGCRMPSTRGLGRYPANVIMDEDAAALLDAQTGTLRSGALSASKQRTRDDGYSGNWGGPITKVDSIPDSGGASRFLYCPKVKGEERKHPTQKPVPLVEWLARLLLPPAGGERRILIPYAGYASEMLGAQQAGWDRAVGIERDPYWCAKSRQRLGLMV